MSTQETTPARDPRPALRMRRGDRTGEAVPQVPGARARWMRRKARPEQVGEVDV